MRRPVSKSVFHFTNPSKVERKTYNTTVMAREAIAEANCLRERLSGRRILEARS